MCAESANLVITLDGPACYSRQTKLFSTSAVCVPLPFLAYQQTFTLVSSSLSISQQRSSHGNLAKLSTTLSTFEFSTNTICYAAKLKVEVEAAKVVKKA